jgi:hypothetical protein
MNRYLSFSLAVSMTLATLAIPLRAANKPRAGKPEVAPVVWTNEDLEKLRGLGLISVVGQVPEETAVGAAAPEPYVRTQDPVWYAAQAANLRTELASREAELQQYRQAIEDAWNLKTTPGGINLDEGDIGITPEASIEILERRVEEAHADFDALEDLARRNDIPPGILRGQ